MQTSSSKLKWILRSSLFVFGLFGISIPFETKHFSIVLFVLGIAILFVFIALKTINSSLKNQYKAKNGFLIFSISLFAFSILSEFKQFPGTSFERVIAVFFYCFAFAPLELHLKYLKWKEYSQYKWEILLLSSIDFLGMNFVLLGFLSLYQNWPVPWILIYSGSGLLLLGLVLWNYRFKKEVVRRKEAEEKIRLQVAEIEKAKEQSDTLLLNILPREVAEELKSTGTSDARHFDEVTVLFTDFKDFTGWSSKMSALELVEEINTCFMAFDKITEKYGVEKIKTIGDSYMCAGGLPVSNKTHAEDVVRAGLEMQEFIKEYSLKRKALGKEPFQIRIGIHTGPVVAGIVGIKKFAYDIWGDTVNTASRMESAAEPGKVNISMATWQKINFMFSCTYRGKISVKAKGELDMYFVDRELPTN